MTAIRWLLSPFTILNILSQSLATLELLNPQPAQLHIRQIANPGAAATPSVTATPLLPATPLAGSATPLAGTATPAAPTNNANQNQASRPATSTSYTPPLDSPVGGLTYTQPPATAAASYYKIAENNVLTMGWNYTNILQFGQSITIAAFCSLNKITYTITTLPAVATAVTWDPYALQQMPGYPAFAVATYTMLIFDERGPTAPPVAGLMSPNSALKFAMYKPQPYTPLASWTCSTCSGAASFSQYSPVMLASAVTLVTVIAGGWFGVLAGIR